MLKKKRDRSIIIILSGVLIILTSLIIVSAAQQINRCQELGTANTIYLLNQSIPDVTGDCFIITKDNITLDGQFNAITGDNGADDYGVEVNTTAETRRNITIKNLVIRQFGRGISFYNVFNSTIKSNTIENTTQGVFSAYGIYIENSSKINVTSNTIFNIQAPNKDSISIYLRKSIDNELSNNIAFSSLGGNNAYGVLIESSHNNLLLRNTCSSLRTFGIGLAVGVALKHSLDNKLEENKASFNVVDSGLPAYGLYLQNSTNNTYINNTANNNEGYGLYLLESANNTFTEDLVNNSRRDAIRVQGEDTDSNNFSRIDIENTSIGYPDLNFFSSNMDFNWLIDMPHIGNYSFGNDKVYFKDTTAGEIRYLEGITGTGTNLTRDVNIKFNLATAESDNNNGLNKSAEITLYNQPLRFNPRILRNSVDICNDNTKPSCHAITELNSGDVIFNVTAWTNYSIEEGPYTNVTACRNLNETGMVYALRNSVSTTGNCFIISANDVTLDLNGFTATGDVVANNADKDYGVYINGTNGTTVKNGKVYDFEYGVWSNGGNNGLFNKLAVKANGNFGSFSTVYNMIMVFGGNNIITNNDLSGSTSTGSDSIINPLRLSSSDNNYVENNTLISVEASHFADGIQIYGNNNTIKNNVVIKMDRDSITVSTKGNNLFINNIINSSGRYGLRIFSTTQNNSFSNGEINSSTQHAIFLTTGATSNNFTNIKISNTNANYNDLQINDPNLNNNYFIDMPHIGKYNITGTGSKLIFKKTELGQIKFLSVINGSGTNLSNDVKIAFNFTEVLTNNNIGLNKSADITLYNMTDGFTNPKILRNNVNICDTTTSPSCYAFTSLNAGTVILNVSSWTNYSIGEAP